MKKKLCRMKVIKCILSIFPTIALLCKYFIINLQDMKRSATTPHDPLFYNFNKKNLVSVRSILSCYCICRSGMTNYENCEK